MNFTKWDMTIVLGMAITVIFMSFTFPALNLTGSEVNESNIPEFNMSQNTFNISGDFPEKPGVPSQGTVTYYENKSGGGEQDQAWLTGFTDDGLEHLLLKTGSPNMELRVNSWQSGTAIVDTFPFSSESDTFTYQNNSWIIEYNVTNYENQGLTNFTTAVAWQIRQTPSDSSWWDGIPILGGILSSGADLAGMLGWFGSIILWFFTTLFELVLNAVIVLTNITVYLISTVIWLSSTYFSIASGAAGFGQIIVAIPGILLSLEFAKLAMIGIKLLPQT